MPWTSRNRLEHQHSKQTNSFTSRQLLTYTYPWGDAILWQAVDEETEEIIFYHNKIKNQ